MKIVFILPLAFLFACSDVPTNTEAQEDISVVKDTTSSDLLNVKRKISRGLVDELGKKCVGNITMYNEGGQIVEELDFGSCGVLFKKVECTNNNSRTVSSKIISDLENVMYNWVYNDEGQVIEKVATHATVSFQYKLTYTYNSSGDLVEYKGTMEDGSAFNGTSRKEYTFENGLKTKTLFFSGADFNEEGYRIDHVYDDNGQATMDLVYKDPSSDRADTTLIYFEYY